MFGLSRDFVLNGGIFMILNKEGGLKTDDLNSVQTGMMTGNRIPGLLELRIKEVDFQVELHYDISGRRMLSQIWKSGGISTSAFYQILFEVADVLHRSPQYMLDIRQFILHEDYIFVNGSDSREAANLTYVPLQGGLYGGHIGDQFKQLVIRLMTRVGHFHGENIHHILELCDRNEIDLGTLKELLLQGMTTGAESVSVQGESVESYNRNAHISKKAKEVHDRLQPQAAYEKSFASQSSLRHHSERGGVYEQEHQESVEAIQELTRMNRFKQTVRSEESGEVDAEREEMEPAIQKYKTYIALGCLLASAVVWRYIYLDHSETVPLIISVVLTAILATVAYISWTGKWGFKGASSPIYADSVPVLESEWLGAASPAQRRNDRYQVEKLTGFITGGQYLNKRFSDPSNPRRESWRWPIPGPKSENMGSQAAEDREAASARYDLYNSPGKGAVQGSELEASETSETSETSEAYYKSLSGITELLHAASRQETVLLCADQGTHIPHVQQSPIACLERKAPGSGATEHIQLQLDQFVAGSFFIGRDPQLVQFVEDTEGASRSHIELCIDTGGQGHIVKDLSSTNGTILNGEPMVPYKEYILNEGDTFKIAGVSYTYRLDSFKSSHRVKEYEQQQQVG
ncbi:DUF6382 domain-containing protein [Paenibacillus farraposensis]|uniref:DUF6382 domain-containing protein n=1 Tax=Paenibacillus farraposensis TaxID=2807095 RepID=A0ABW4D8Z9_9BACL|nr:DUF6382 domain-containing protein [Paenibacillus farraposensis]MCC3381863.1 FHA domain-containing protein [Paenibacillus farraposensis]